MSKFMSFVARTVPWLIVGGFGLGAGFLLLAATELLWGPYTCITIVQQKMRDVSGYDFESSKTINCDVAINVLAAKVGQPKKTLIFKFSPPVQDAIPTITSIDHNSVQISILRVPFIFCRKDKWEALTVKYNIGVMDYRHGEPDDEC
jgi:hypothetical protein